MDVEIGSRAETLDERDRAGHGFGTFESRLLDQKCRYHPVDDLQDRREQLWMGGETAEYQEMIVLRWLQRPVLSVLLASY